MIYIGNFFGHQQQHFRPFFQEIQKILEISTFLGLKHQQNIISFHQNYINLSNINPRDFFMPETSYLNPQKQANCQKPVRCEGSTSS